MKSVKHILIDEVGGTEGSLSKDLWPDQAAREAVLDEIIT